MAIDTSRQPIELAVADALRSLSQEAVMVVVSHALTAFSAAFTSDGLLVDVQEADSTAVLRVDGSSFLTIPIDQASLVPYDGACSEPNTAWLQIQLPESLTVLIKRLTRSELGR